MNSTPVWQCWEWQRITLWLVNSKPVRFPYSRQEILEYLIQLKQDFHPDVVFVHTKADLHQDHGTVTEESLRAFRGISVLGFDVLRSSYGFFPTSWWK